MSTATASSQQYRTASFPARVPPPKPVAAATPGACALVGQEQVVISCDACTPGGAAVRLALREAAEDRTFPVSWSTRLSRHVIPRDGLASAIAVLGQHENSYVRLFAGALSGANRPAPSLLPPAPPAPAPMGEATPALPRLEAPQTLTPGQTAGLIETHAPMRQQLLWEII